MREAVMGPNFHRCWQIGEKIMLRHSGAQAETKTFSVIGANTHAKDRSIQNSGPSDYGRIQIDIQHS